MRSISTATVDAELQQLQLSDDAEMRIIDIPGSLLDQSYLVQIWLLTNCIFVWMGSAMEKPRLGSVFG